MLQRSIAEEDGGSWKEEERQARFEKKRGRKETTVRTNVSKEGYIMRRGVDQWTLES